MPDLTGKAILVTGSSRGIGAAMVKDMAANGANVIVNYASSADEANKVVDEINAAGKGKAVAVQGDVSTADGPRHLAEAAIKAFGKVDGVVHNAGVMPRGGGPAFDLETYEAVMNTNVRGPLLLTQALHGQMGKGSSVIFVSSGLTKLSAAPPPELLYIMSKGAVEQAIRPLSKALGAKGIRVLAIAPGPVDTTLFTGPKTQQQIDFFKSLSPFNKLGDPEEIAKVASFVVSDDASWVSGCTWHVNGANQV